jgi:hypothetical protein
MDTFVGKVNWCDNVFSEPEDIVQSPVSSLADPSSWYSILAGIECLQLTENINSTICIWDVCNYSLYLKPKSSDTQHILVDILFSIHVMFLFFLIRALSRWEVLQVVYLHEGANTSGRTFRCEVTEVFMSLSDLIASVSEGTHQYIWYMVITFHGTMFSLNAQVKKNHYLHWRTVN